MDSNSNSNDDDAATATASQGRRRGQLHRVIKATVECLLVGSLFVLSCYGVSDEEPLPRRRRLQGFIALSYAAVIALTLFARRLDARVLAGHGSRERWLKLAARVLASLVLTLLVVRTDSLMAITLQSAFIW